MKTAKKQRRPDDMFKQWIRSIDILYMQIVKSRINSTAVFTNPQSKWVCRLIHELSFDESDQQRNFLAMTIQHQGHRTKLRM